MKINLQVQFEDGTSQEITANAADLVAFEDKFNVSIARLGTESKLSHLMFLAWHASKRQKKTDKPFEEWLDGIESIGDTAEDPKSEG